MEQPINRISHIVWVVEPENIQNYVAQAEALFGVEFEHMDGPKLLGSDRDVYVSWDAGLEFFAPLGSGDPTAAMLLDFLTEHGEGPYGFVFGVADVFDANERAKALGYPGGEMVQPPDPAVRRARFAQWTTKVTDIKEIRVGTFLGAEVIFGEIIHASPPTSD